MWRPAQQRPQKSRKNRAGRHITDCATEEPLCGRPHKVQKFLKKFRPDQCWSLTYSTTCSKPRVGEFGGGAVFVTANKIKWQNAYDFIEQQRTAFKAKRRRRKERKT